MPEDVKDHKEKKICEYVICPKDCSECSFSDSCDKCADGYEFIPWA